MTCPICDQKPMNCDCTETERRQFAEIAELEEQVASLRLTDEEREAIEKAICRELDAEWYGGPEPARVVALRGLLARTTL
jgi:hypothetical protein